VAVKLQYEILKKWKNLCILCYDCDLQLPYGCLFCNTLFANVTILSFQLKSVRLLQVKSCLAA